MADAMYRYFKDKDALFCALVDDATDETLKMVKAAGSTHENFLEKIADIYTENVLSTVHWMKQKFNVTKPIDDMSIHVFATATINALQSVIRKIFMK